MSLYQCEHCGCVDNTALGHYWTRDRTDFYDWQGKEMLAGKELCSACGPEYFADSTEPTGLGHWHGEFERIFLPKGQFETTDDGNLRHIATGDTDFRKFQIFPDDA